MKSRVGGLYITWLCMAIAIWGCGGGGGGGGDTDECAVIHQNAFVYEIMTDSYLWYDQVPDTDHAAYASPTELLEDLKYRPVDKWSYITSTDAYYKWFEEGKYIGAGFGLKFDEAGDYRIKFVYRGSPADRAGLSRGMKILEINGNTIREIEDNDLWDTVFGPEEIGTELRLKIENHDTTQNDIRLSYEQVSIQPVLFQDILDVSGTKTGYLVFKDFIENAHSELDTIFTNFSNQGIEELIVDLRYNSGGRALTALYLAGLISGGRVSPTDVFASTVHNDRYRFRDEVIYFSTPVVSLNLERVFIITTGTTCSASELVINCLEPYMEVVLIGEITCGKPVGMYGHDFCGLHFNPIEVKIVNADGEGDYFSGLAPDCLAGDDLMRPLGDPEEYSLDAAMHYIVQDRCLSDGEAAVERMGRQAQAPPLRGMRGEIGAY